MLLVVCLTVLCALFVPSHPQGTTGNRPPYFVEDLQDILVTKGVYENTTVGTILGSIKCVDPDGDDILYTVARSAMLRIVNDRLGNVGLIKKLDREQTVFSTNTNQKPFSVMFQCIDVIGTKPISQSPTEIEYTINVLDNNDQPPVFSVDLDSGFTFHINESDPIGTVLTGNIEIRDKDQAQNAKLSFLDLVCTADDPAPCRMFNVTDKELDEGEYVANIVLEGKLDFETREDYRVQLRAVDGKGSSERKNTASTGIRIVVLDNQDTDPIFTNAIYNFDVSEGLRLGGTVNFGLSARDGDKDGHRKIRLEILDKPDGHNLFRAGKAVLVSDPRAGGKGSYVAPIFVRTEIDREDSAVSNGYAFTAKAIELDSNEQDTNATATAEFTVNILDVNDNSPTFSQRSYNISVAEMGERTGAVQIPNLRIEVDDPDEPTNAQYRLEIVRQTFSGAFGFTPNSQVSGLQFFYLTVNNFQYLDYDIPSYRLQTVVLKAVEQLANGQPGTRSSTAEVTVYLEDVNDNLPLFSKNIYEDSVNENAPNNTSILKVEASDKDSGQNGEFTFRIQDSVKSVFHIDPITGEITVIGNLDYEKQSDYSFLVFVTDKAAVPKSSQVPVRIRITDYNDDGPVFTLPRYTGRVTESSLTFESPVTVAAKDETEPDAKITYRIVSGNTPTGSFVLNPTTGDLTLRETLNYANTPNKTGIYSLVVEASDNGQPPATTTSRITITVIDENNHSPVFMPTVYSQTLSEAAAPGTSVVQVYATDADFGTNGEISYRIGSGRGRDSFLVTKNGTVLVSNSPNLDYDVPDLRSIKISIIAIDGGSPQQTATASLIISITDANNKPPKFEFILYTAIVNETSKIGTKVIQVSASDPDSTNVVRYSIDKTSMSAINSAGVQVGSVYNYDFTEAFKIDPVTGWITVDGKLDRKYVVELSFKVVAEDVSPTAIGTQKAYSRVTINIRGTTNRELYFRKPWEKNNPVYVVPKLESDPINSEIVTLQAYDPSTPNGDLLKDYKEVPGTDPLDYFRIVPVVSPSGETQSVVVLNKELDFESGNLIHTVVVRAIKDDFFNGAPDSRTVTATISIQVQDANDNAPEFSQALYSFNVREDVPVNFRVGTVAVYDRDSSTFGPIELSLAGGIDWDHFRLYQPTDDGTAQVLVNKPLDFENRRTYDIGLFATDNMRNAGTSKLTGKAVMHIQVLDVNDNSPVFTDLKRSFSVPEIAPVNSVLGTVLATDADYGLNGKLSYYLVRDNSSSSDDAGLTLFGVRRDSGVLYTRQSLRGLGGSYVVRLIAEDAGVPPISSSIPVTIKVQSAQDDDGTPQWLEPVNNVVVLHPENEIGLLNVRIMAKSRTEDGDIRYNLVKYSTDYLNFDIDPVHGNISVTEYLDREEQPRYTLVVQATDTKNTSKISRRTLIVELIDKDDNDPTFEATKYDACPNDFQRPTEFKAMDNTPKGVIVGQAQACDPDAEPNNRAYYYKYTEGPYCSYYGMALNVLLNGSIESNEMLDYDVKPVYRVCVLVTKSPRVDGGRKKRQIDISEVTRTKDVAYINIKMIDVNDQRPIFKDIPYLSVIEATPSEPTVTNVYAVDKDGPEFSKVTYDISDTMFYPYDSGRPYSLRGAFAVDSNTGAITTNLPSYSDFMGGYFELTVDAFDVRNKLFNDTVKIKVIVYHRSQVLRVVMNKDPSQGQVLAQALVRELDGAGQPQVAFIFKSASEHRTKDSYVATQTDCCFVAVQTQENRIFETGDGLSLLEQGKYNNILIKKEYSVIQKGTCYPVRSSRESVKWRDLWWVLVVIAIFIFVCCIILIATVCILYNRYKDYMTTEKTYLVPQ